MGKSKKEAAETAVTAPTGSALAEESLFVPDQETDTAAKNRALATSSAGRGRAGPSCASSGSRSATVAGGSSTASSAVRERHAQRGR